MVCNAVVYHPTVSHLLKYLDTTVGRDKLVRLVQYWARFLAFFYQRRGYSAKQVEPWKQIVSIFALSRKLFRVGKPIGHLKSAATAYDNKATDPFIRYTAIGRQLGYAGYLTLDTLVFVNNSKIKPLENGKNIQKLANQMWLSGLIFGILSGIYKLRGQYKQQRALLAQVRQPLEKPESTTISEAEQEITAEEKVDAAILKRVSHARKATAYQLIQDLFDFVIPLYALQIQAGSKTILDEGIVGIAGMISSLMGANTQWEATA